MKNLIIGIALALLSSPMAAQEPQSQREALAAMRERPYVQATRVRSQRVYAPYSNEEQARARRAARIVEDIRRDEEPTYYRFRSRRDRNGELPR